MSESLFILGRTPQLAYLELQTYIPEVTLLHSGVAVSKSEVSDPLATIARLGGTVKIAQVVETLSQAKQSIEELTDAVFRLLRQLSTDKKLVYGLSIYGAPLDHNPTKKILFSLKQLCVQHNVTARFVEAQHGDTLSSVVIAKQQVHDIVLAYHEGQLRIAKTVAIQDFEDWNTRDFGRPSPDAHKGMLPPKVARMIINIGIQNQKHALVLDPFCGVGTVLSEALLLGNSVIGSDISSVAIAHTEQNISWLKQKYPIDEHLSVTLKVHDATHVTEFVAAQSIDAIVTEPFMGDLAYTKFGRIPTEIQVKNIMKGLEKLYIGALRQWHEILKVHGRIVMAFPVYKSARGGVSVKKVIDRCETLGYTLVAGPLEYSRPDAIVRRNFYIFQKK